MSATATILPEITKRIAYNKEDGDYSCYISVDGAPEEYIGSAPTHPAAEMKCRDYAFLFFNDTDTPEKAVRVTLPSSEPFGVLADGTDIHGENDLGGIR